MHIGQEIEEFRTSHNLTVYCIAMALDMTELEYRAFTIGRYKPAAYQLIFFLTGFKCPLDSIIGKIFDEYYPYSRNRCDASENELR